MTTNISVKAQVVETRDIFDGEISGNYSMMANALHIENHIYGPDKIGITRAWQLIEPLRAALAVAVADPARLYDLEREGRGRRTAFIEFLEDYLQACEEHPEGVVSVE